MESKIYKVKIRGQEIEVEQLPNGKFKVPAISQFVNVQSGCTWLDDCRIPFNSFDNTEYIPNRVGYKNGVNHTKKHNASNPFVQGQKENEDIEQQTFNEKGRFPANLLVSDDALNDGKITKNFRPNCFGKNYDNKRNLYGKYNGKNEYHAPQDKGSYSRYFDLDAWHKKNKKDGRFPANLIVSDDALNDGKNHKSSPLNHMSHGWGDKSLYGGGNKIVHVTNPGDSGSYSRYFDLDAWFLAIPKASASERNKGCEDLQGKVRFASENKSGSMLPTKTDKPHTVNGNFHPTVKPIKLMSYLITMGSRENDLILDPFCGSGTTCIAATILNRKFIGIELNKEYVDIANKRLEPYLKQTKLC